MINTDKSAAGVQLTAVSRHLPALPSSNTAPGDGYVADGQLRAATTKLSLSITSDHPVTVTLEQLQQTFSGQVFPHSSHNIIAAWQRDERSAPQEPASPSAEPHLSLLQAMEQSYPRLAARVRMLESRADEIGFTPFRSAQLEARVLSDPPWSTRKYPKREAEWLEHMRAAHPESFTADISAFDVPAAALDCAYVAWDLDTIFPQEKYPEVSVAARVKEPRSLQEKLDRMLDTDPGYTIANVPDTVAGRVDTPDLATLGQASHRIEDAYGDRILAKIDYLSQPGKNGYRAIHYIVDYGDRAVELQLTTRNFRTADLATHDTVYKDVEGRVSKDMKQQFLLLSAMAMMVDGISYLHSRMVGDS